MSNSFSSPAAACHEDAGRSEGEDVESDRVRDVPPGFCFFGHIKSFFACRLCAYCFSLCLQVLFVSLSFIYCKIFSEEQDHCPDVQDKAGSTISNKKNKKM